MVEHWDNIQLRVGEMVSGSTEITDQDSTEENRSLATNLIDQVFLNKKYERFKEYVDVRKFVEHGTFMPLLEKAENLTYKKSHRILAEGNFVLSVGEGYNGEQHSSFYDLFRIEKGKVVEHWDTTEKVPPREEWKNNNGKF